MKILMVCLGNICRSPLAEGILQKKLSDTQLNCIVDSAGTNGYHLAEPPHRLSQKVAKAFGIDISRQQSRKFNKEDFYDYDRIYAMSADVKTEIMNIAKAHYNPAKTMLLMDECQPGKNIDIPDPWYGTETDYLLVFNMISKACDALIENARAIHQQSTFDTAPLVKT